LQSVLSTSMRATETDIVIIGAGVVGAALAYGLARNGHSVLLLDEGDIARRASRGNFALVWVQGKGFGLPAYTRWTRRSADAWHELSGLLQADTGIDVQHSRPGGFSLCLSDAELQSQANEMARLHNQLDREDYPYEFLDHEATRKRLSDIGPDVVGSIFCPLDGHVNSLKLFRALHEGFQGHGGHYEPDRPVTAILPAQDGFRITGIWGEVRARTIVLAAGLDNARLAPMVGLHAPVAPNRGHIMVTEKIAPFLHHPVVNIRQTDEGGVMIGDSHEAGITDSTVRRPLVSAIAARAIRLFPLLADLNIVRTWSALRVMSLDGFPIYDHSPTMPGAFVACCHSGITLAAIHALELAPAIAAGHLRSETYAPFSGGRFHVPAAA
jgi:hydrogen cyanide synthase HcnC